MLQSFKCLAIGILLPVLLFRCGSKNLSAVRNSATGIQWVINSLRQLSFPAPGKLNVHYSYPRMIQLKNNELLCVYENSGSIEIVRSSNNGSSWSLPATIIQQRENINIANPEILELTDGQLVVAYNLRPRQNTDNTYDAHKKFSICIKRSSDKGATWSDEQVLYEAGSDFRNGCWEPSMIQMPSGKVLLFFANEGIYTSSEEQNISVLTSVDNGISWDKQPRIVSFAKGFRDGMPVPVYDAQQQELLLAIEDNSEGGEFNPSVIKADLSDSLQFVDKNSNNRVHLLQSEISTQVYAGAPYIRQLKDGTIILSFQSTLNRRPDWQFSDMEVAVGNSVQKLTLTNKPFNIPHDKSALWNALCVLNDDIIIALTSTNAFNNYNAIWMIKGSFKK